MIRLPLVLAIATLAGVAAAQTKLDLGDAAPPLKVAKWVKGTPVPAFQKGKVYVVEFWATWCGPCRQAMPHISEIARKYSKDVTVVAVSVNEQNDGTNAYQAKVADFVKSQGKNMDYNVAVDDLAGTVDKSWMRAAGQGGIPTSFIVNRDGKVVWIGGPMTIEKPLAQVIDGTYDMSALVAQKNRENELGRKHREEFAALNEASKANDYAKIETEVDRLWDIYPNERQNLMFQKAHALSMQGSGMTDYLRSVVAKYPDDRPIQWSAAWIIVDPRFTYVKEHDWDFAIRTAQRAVDLATVPDWNAEFILALAYNGKGDYKKADEIQAHALQLAAKAPELTPEEIQKMRDMMKRPASK